MELLPPWLIHIRRLIVVGLKASSSIRSPNPWTVVIRGRRYKKHIPIRNIMYALEFARHLKRSRPWDGNAKCCWLVLTQIGSRPRWSSLVHSRHLSLILWEAVLWRQLYSVGARLFLKECMSAVSTWSLPDPYIPSSTNQGRKSRTVQWWSVFFWVANTSSLPVAIRPLCRCC